jgi:dTDP-4-dehydrorhamnose reductase
MILFFGRSGQLAQSFQATLPKELDGQVLFVSSREANFEKPGILPGFLDKHGPQIVVLCAAYTQVDKAEEERDLAEAINVKAPQAIARWCGTNDCLLIHFSTDYVFDGSGVKPWEESDETGPLNWYGETKLDGEDAIRLSGCRHLIFRTSWVFSEYGKNFLRTMLRLGKDKEKLQVVSDQVGNPTYAPALAEAVWKIIQRELKGERFSSGIFHAAGLGETSWHHFAETIFQEARALNFQMKVNELGAIPSADFPTPAHRPANSRLNQAKFLKTFGFQLPSWQDSVRLCLRRIRSQPSLEP